MNLLVLVFGMLGAVAAAASAAPGPFEAAAAGRPIAVSPGHAARVERVASRCPTFSWGVVAGARSLELAVYRLNGEEEEPRPVLRAGIDGRAASWTPALGHCLERGGRYAWSLRARRAGEGSAWSVPLLFEVAPGPVVSELEAAPAIVREAAPARGRHEEAAPSEDAPARDAVAAPGGAGQRHPGAAGNSPVPVGLSVEGGVAAAAFSGDGSALTGVEAAGLACSGCVATPELVDGAVTAAKIGAACATGELLVRGAAGWECASLTAPACTAGDEIGCYTGPQATRGVGECRGGARICQADATWGACVGEVTPAAAESCDGLDNTCDGDVDEGDPQTLCPPTANVVSAACEAEGCAITGCAELWADADGDYATGCEAPVPGACLDGGTPRAIAGPGAGQLVIRELMADPLSPLADADAEWFEVAAQADVDLNDLQIGTTFGTVIDQIVADDCLAVEAGEVLLFARSAEAAANGGLAPDHLFGFSLVNGGGDLHLAYGGDLVDAVSWSGSEVDAGRARNLPAAAEDATSNDDPASWCSVPADPALAYATGNYGTPGLANVDCP